MAAAVLLLVAGAETATAQVDVPVEEPSVPVEATSPGGAEPRGGPQGRAASDLEGLFRLAPGECGSGSGVEAGSWFRMVDPGGGYVENNDSPCSDKTWTPLSPGTDGGLVTGDYQPHPDPAFTSSGDARADSIMEPQLFFGVRFSTATSPVDPQTGTEVDAPRITHDGSGGLGGDLRAWGAAWSNQHFNQGAPKPDGSRPGGTEGPAGTYDGASGAYAIEWKSRIQGGPFDNFTGVWHLEGVFEGASAPASGPAAPGGATSPGGTEVAGSAVTSGNVSAGSSGRLAATGGAAAVVLALLIASGGLVGLRFGRHLAGR